MTHKTRSEQRLEWLNAEQRQRALTTDEQAEIPRCLHAIYMRNWKRQRERRELAAAAA